MLCISRSTFRSLIRIVHFVTRPMWVGEAPLKYVEIVGPVRNLSCYDAPLTVPSSFWVSLAFRNSHSKVSTVIIIIDAPREFMKDSANQNQNQTMTQLIKPYLDPILYLPLWVETALHFLLIGRWPSCSSKYVTTRCLGARHLVVALFVCSLFLSFFQHWAYGCA